MLYLGCHLSSSKGFAAMGRTALSIGANTFQFFTRNPRGGAAKEIVPADAAALVQMQDAGEIGRIVAHAPYTLNPCAKRKRRSSLRAIRCRTTSGAWNMCRGTTIISTPEATSGRGMDEGIRKIAETLDVAMFDAQTTTVLLETMAGKGTEVGGRFCELRQIIDRVSRPEKLGVCLDTCHVNDAGYDIAGSLDAVLEEFDREIGLSRLRALHLNDSKNPLGAHKDRHERLGEGYLGLEAFYRIIEHPALRGLPMILETPNELPGYAAEIALLREHDKAADANKL